MYNEELREAEMELESYFDFFAADDIRIRGTRIGIESILYEYVHRGRTAEEIDARFPSVSLDQVYATILLYLRDREHYDAYLTDWLAWAREAREEQVHNPPPALRRLRARKADRSVEQA